MIENGQIWLNWLKNGRGLMKWRQKTTRFDWNWFGNGWKTGGNWLFKRSIKLKTVGKCNQKSWNIWNQNWNHLEPTGTVTIQPINCNRKPKKKAPKIGRFVRNEAKWNQVANETSNLSWLINSNCQIELIV